jgi:hypothetical protein
MHACGKRQIDAVIIVGAVVFALEFKVGEATFDRAAFEQVWDQALDLKNFHEASHTVSIIPVLVATEAGAELPIKLLADSDNFYRPIGVGVSGIRALIELAVQTVSGLPVDAVQWPRTSYRPTA